MNLTLAKCYYCYLKASLVLAKVLFLLCFVGESHTSKSAIIAYCRWVLHWQKCYYTHTNGAFQTLLHNTNKTQQNFLLTHESLLPARLWFVPLIILIHPSLDYFTPLIVSLSLDYLNLVISLSLDYLNPLIVSSSLDYFVPLIISFI